MPGWGMRPRRLALSVQAGWVGSWPEWDLYGMGCRIACGKHVFAHGASEREVGTSFTVRLSQLYQCWIRCWSQSHSVAPWLQFAFPQLHYSWRKGEKKKKKKHHLGLNLLPHLPKESWAGLEG